METNNNCQNCNKSTKCFHFLVEDELDFINTKKTQIKYLKGETIFKQGAFAPYVLYVVEGLAKVFIQTGNARILNIRLAKENDFMAYSSIFGGDYYNYSATALKDSTICMIDKNALKQLIMKNPEFSMQITSKNINNELRFLEIIENVSSKQMRGKLASTLLYLSAEEFLKEGIFKYLTRQDIADFASTTLESAVRFIKEFEQEGLIELHGKEIRIIDKEKLMELKQIG